MGLIVLFSGCAQLQQGASPNQPIIQYVCSDGTVVVDKTLCPIAGSGATQPLKQLTIEEELNVCAGMPETKSGSFEDICIMGLAAKHTDASLCRKVSQDQRVTCYSMIAEVTEDPDACLDAGLQKDQCYNNYAMNSSNPEVCDKITDIGMKDNCYSNFASMLGDPAFCGKIKTADMKNNCYFQIAQRLGDNSFCQEITNAGMKENCLQQTGNRGLSQPVMEIRK